MADKVKQRTGFSKDYKGKDSKADNDAGIKQVKDAYDKQSDYENSVSKEANAMVGANVYKTKEEPKQEPRKDAIAHAPRTITPSTQTASSSPASSGSSGSQPATEPEPPKVDTGIIDPNKKAGSTPMGDASNMHTGEASSTQKTDEAEGKGEPKGEPKKKGFDWKNLGDALTRFGVGTADAFNRAYGGQGIGAQRTIEAEDAQKRALEMKEKEQAFTSSERKEAEAFQAGEGVKEREATSARQEKELASKEGIEARRLESQADLLAKQLASAQSEGDKNRAVSTYIANLDAGTKKELMGVANDFQMKYGKEMKNMDRESQLKFIEEKFKNDKTLVDKAGGWGLAGKGIQLIPQIIDAFVPFEEGGYTGEGAADEPAGVVHKGEYVVPKNLVNQDTGTPKPAAFGLLASDADTKIIVDGGTPKFIMSDEHKKAKLTNKVFSKTLDKHKDKLKYKPKNKTYAPANKGYKKGGYVDDAIGGAPKCGARTHAECSEFCDCKREGSGWSE